MSSVREGRKTHWLKKYLLWDQRHQLSFWFCLAYVYLSFDFHLELASVPTDFCLDSSWAHGRELRSILERKVWKIEEEGREIKRMPCEEWEERLLEVSGLYRQYRNKGHTSVGNRWFGMWKIPYGRYITAIQIETGDCYLSHPKIPIVSGEMWHFDGTMIPWSRCLKVLWKMGALQVYGFSFGLGFLIACKGDLYN